MKRQTLLSLALAFTLGALATQALPTSMQSVKSTKSGPVATKAVNDKAVVSPDLAHRKKRIWV
ncbi:hypothetical protein [Paraburkholderia aromaticivorans]|uniref:hypothetical protein n=1 Tax=Paraburkholderia aromaticivorans TaxID=2026199 RepID=UPI0038BDDA95